MMETNRPITSREETIKSVNYTRTEISFWMKNCVEFMRCTAVKYRSCCCFCISEPFLLLDQLCGFWDNGIGAVIKGISATSLSYNSIEEEIKTT